jgi:hypothetical protein
MRARLLLAATCAVALTAAAVPPAHAAPTRVCKSADMRYPFQPGGPKTFGVFRLQVTGGGCPLARRIAKRWMDRFEANLRDGHATLPRRVGGFRFRSLPPREAQTYRLRGRRDGTTIRFDYRVPNG